MCYIIIRPQDRGAGRGEAKELSTYLLGVFTSSTCLVKVCFIDRGVDVDEFCSMHCKHVEHTAVWVLVGI